MSIFGLLKRKKKIEDKQEQFIESKPMINDRPDPIMQMMAGIPETNTTEQVKMKTYDILVFEQDNSGNMKQKKIDGVKAVSPQALVGMYASADAKIRILREYDENPSQPSPKEKEQKQQPQAAEQQTVQNQEAKKEKQQEAIAVETRKKSDPPKFFDIGGIKCKLEDGKMFQEQWIRVDSTKYRLIADASNKICPMSGKHLETLKWVQIENTEENNGNGEENA